MRKWSPWLAAALLLALAACAAAPPCDRGPDGREGGIGGTGICADPPEAV